MGRFHANRRRAVIESLEGRLLLTATELIRNGSFEGPAVASDWIAAGNFQADARFPNPHSGTGYAYLSNTDGSMGNSINGSIYQQVSIPATSTALTLSFWTYINTQETTTTTQYDLLTVKIMDSTGASQLDYVATLGNLNASSGYVRRSYSLPLSLAGQTVRVLFSASNDGAKPTTFRLDDVGFSYAPMPTTMRVVGYMPGATDVNQIDFGLLTWVNYTPLTVNDDGSINAGSINASSLASVVTAAHAKGCGVSITVIQPGPSYTALTNIAASATARAAFANNILAYIQSHNLDGVDIDYEPSPSTGAAQSNYALLIDSLYAVLHPYGYAITSASNPITHEIPVAATNEMDWINVMCYDFGYANVAPYSSTINGMNGWASYGVDKRKLVMGVPFYGRYGTSWSDTHAKSYGDSSLFGSTNHILSNYKSINGSYPASSVDSYTDQNGNTTYFNGIDTMQAKMAFVRDNGFGGAMIWALLYDHWNSSNQYDSYSLLPVISSMLRPPTWLTPDAGSTYDFVGNVLYVDQGDVTLSATAWLASPGLSLSTAAGTTVKLGANQRFSSIAIGGTLDLLDNTMVVDMPGAIGSWNGNAYTGITGLIQTGRNGGNWNGAGIITSEPSAEPSSSPLTTIAVATGAQVKNLTGSTTALWSGQTIAAGSTLVMYTYAGDANLDGRVNGDDYFNIDSHVNQNGSVFGWFNGDFNYDGNINGDDYFLIDSTINQQGAPLAVKMPPALNVVANASGSNDELFGQSLPPVMDWTIYTTREQKPSSVDALFSTAPVAEYLN